VVFTVNLPDGKTWSEYDINALRCELNTTFFICGKETGEGGRKHFQGYFEFAEGTKKKGSSIDKVFRKRFPLPISCHYETARGTAEDNIKYCSKEDTSPYKEGEPHGNQSGKRNDIIEVLKQVKEGKSELEIAEENAQLWIQYRKGIQAFRELVTEKRNWPTKLIFIWGPTGTGKTMHAQELNPTPVFWASDSFLNGFHGEETLLFDDFDYSKMSWQHFLLITDRYPCNINIKGGSMNFAPKTIIFTSNSDPRGWWPRAPEETRKAIHRRMDEFGDTKYLGEFVPKETTLLEKYFTKKTPVSTTTTTTAAEPSLRSIVLAPTPQKDTREIVIIESDDDEPPPLKRESTTSFHYEFYDSDSAHSAHSIAKRRREGGGGKGSQESIEY